MITLFSELPVLFIPLMLWLFAACTNVVVLKKSTNVFSVFFYILSMGWIIFIKFRFELRMGMEFDEPDMFLDSLAARNMNLSNPAFVYFYVSILILLLFAMSLVWSIINEKKIKSPVQGKAIFMTALIISVSQIMVFIPFLRYVIEYSNITTISVIISSMILILLLMFDLLKTKHMPRKTSISIGIVIFAFLLFMNTYEVFWLKDNNFNESFYDKFIYVTVFFVPAIAGGCFVLKETFAKKMSLVATTVAFSLLSFVATVFLLIDWFNVYPIASAIGVVLEVAIGCIIIVLLKKKRSIENEKE